MAPVKIGSGDTLASFPVLREVASSSDPIWRTVEVCERIASVFLLVALIPLMLASAAAIRLLSGRSPLIAHRRVGWQGSELWMLKLRTMWGPEPGSTGWVEYIEDSIGPGDKRAGDPRVGNRFASFCRRHSIDELRSCGM